MTNLVNTVDHYLKLMATVFKGTELIRPWSVGRRSDVMRRRPDLGVRCYEETVRWNPRDHTLRYVSVGVCKISIMGFTWSPHLSFIFLRLALLLLA